MPTCPDCGPPLEAQLIDLADEVAYNTADLDDALSAGLIRAEDVADAVPQYREIHEAVETQFPGATARERFHEALRQLIDLLVSGLIEGTVNAAEGAAWKLSRTCALTRCAWPQFTPEAAETSRALKRFLYARVYASDALGSDRRLSMARIAELFHFFLASPERLPAALCATGESTNRLTAWSATTSRA